MELSAIAHPVNQPLEAFGVAAWKTKIIIAATLLRAKVDLLSMLVPVQ